MAHSRADGKQILSSKSGKGQKSRISSREKKKSDGSSLIMLPAPCDAAEQGVQLILGQEGGQRAERLGMVGKVAAGYQARQ